jgi:hypothetical protein
MAALRNRVNRELIAGLVRLTPLSIAQAQYAWILDGGGGIR